MKILTMILFALVGVQAHAADGNPTGCYELALSLPADLDNNTPGEAVLKTGGSMCLTETDMAVDNVTDLTSTGKIHVAVTDAQSAQVAVYDYNSKMTTASTDTVTSIYSNDLAALKDGSATDTLELHMSLDHTTSGQLAGYAVINGQRFELYEK